jgi:SAM-dependent methyltransferase
VKNVVLRLQGRVGLLLFVFRGRERWRSIGVSAVAGTADANWFLEGGRPAEVSIRAALERAGAPIASLKAILDFGCGRVIRRWHDLDARICGGDLSNPAIMWCRANLPFAEVDVNQLEPPLSYDDASFDLVYALSVLTHLPVDTQRARLNEMRRVIGPGGLSSVIPPWRRFRRKTNKRGTLDLCKWRLRRPLGGCCRIEPLHVLSLTCLCAQSHRKRLDVD